MSLPTENFCHHWTLFFYFIYLLYPILYYIKKQIPRIALTILPYICIKLNEFNSDKYWIKQNKKLKHHACFCAAHRKKHAHCIHHTLMPNSNQQQNIITQYSFYTFFIIRIIYYIQTIFAVLSFYILHNLKKKKKNFSLFLMSFSLFESFFKLEIKIIKLMELK